MINIIEKETIVSKGEKGHIKNCALTGKILMLQTVLGVSTINSENILTIFKILFDLIQTKILEEAILQILNNFLLKTNEGFYVELKEKKLTKFFDKFLTLLNKILPNKTNLGSIKTLYEFSLIFCLLSFKDAFPSINNFLHHNTSQIILTENSLSNFFKLLLTQNIREGEFHSCFKLFLNFLTRLNDFTKVIEIWNVLIDPNSQEIFKAVSQKNLQFLIYSVSKYLMEKYFILKYIKQIFDSSYFDNLMKFSSNKKFKFINSLIETLMAGMKSVSESEKELLADYSKDLLSVFGNDGGLSPQTYKNFFNFLFNNLSDDAKNDFIYILTKTGETEEADSEFLHFQISALKILMASNESTLQKVTKNKILEFFFKVYYSGEEREDIEVESIIEDRLLSVVFSYIRIPKIEPTEEEDAKPIKDKKIIKLLLQVHKFLQTMYESKMLEDLDMDDYKVFLILIIRHTLNSSKRFLSLPKTF